jgi:hypothetical protein
MWICLNNAFFSIVQSEQPDRLSVRARRKGDLERHFPGHEVLALPGRDYAFRAFIPREVVAHTLSELVQGIAYGNFKGSVSNPDLHDAYADVWSVMAALDARGGAYGRRRLS